AAGAGADKSAPPSASSTSQAVFVAAKRFINTPPPCVHGPVGRGGRAVVYSPAGVGAAPDGSGSRPVASTPAAAWPRRRERARPTARATHWPKSSMYVYTTGKKPSVSAVDTVRPPMTTVA